MAGVDLDAGTAAFLVVAIATLLVALGLLALDFTSRVHRAFCLLLLVRALLDGSLAFIQDLGDLGGRLRPYLYIALPFAAFHFAFVYRRRYGFLKRRSWWAHRWVVPSLILVLVTGFETLFFLDHDLFVQVRPEGEVVYGPLAPFVFLPAPAFAAVALLLARDAGREGVVSRRLALITASLGLLLQPLFYASFRLMDTGFDLIRTEEDLFPAFFQVVETAAYGLTGILMAAALVRLHAAARTLPTARISRRLLPMWASAVACSAITAYVFAFLTSPEGLAWRLAVLQVFNALWTLPLPLLVAYALVRHRLFDVEPHLRFAIRGTTLAAVFFAVFFVVTETAQQFFGERIGAYYGIAASGLLVFAIAPLQRLADRLAQRAVAAGEPLGTLPHPDRIRLYQEQLEIAWGDGRLTPKERLLFDRLRKRLGITAEQAAKMETEILERTRPLPQAGPGRAAGT